MMVRFARFLDAFGRITEKVMDRAFWPLVIVSVAVMACGFIPR